MGVAGNHGSQSFVHDHVSHALRSAAEFSGQAALVYLQADSFRRPVEQNVRHFAQRAVALGVCDDRHDSLRQKPVKEFVHKNRSLTLGKLHEQIAASCERADPARAQKLRQIRRPVDLHARMQLNCDIRMAKGGLQKRQAVVQIFCVKVFVTSALVCVRRCDDVRNACLLRHLCHHDAGLVVVCSVIQPGQNVGVDIDHYRASSSAPTRRSSSRNSNASARAVSASTS